MAFADAIDRLNAAVTIRLSDVVAQVDGQSVSGLFDREHASIDGISATMIALDVESAAVPFVEQGSTVVIGIETFSVKNVVPSGGRTLLQLEAED